jgi:Mrp family chromosome partitioning ATPase
MSTVIDNDQELRTKNDTKPAVKEVNQIKHIIGVMSSKGGVGKSFVTGLLGSNLASKGYHVGILDADFK